MKRRSVKPKTPNVFSVKLKAGNLEKLSEIQNELCLDNRNMTINHIIENYYLYTIVKPFVGSLRDMVKKFVLNEVNRKKYPNLFKD